jgi:hypothetical protein
MLKKQLSRYVMDSKVNDYYFSGLNRSKSMGRHPGIRKEATSFVGKLMHDNSR